MRDWNINLDLNYDGFTSITDIRLLAKSLFQYPGDFVVKNTIGTDLGNFLELTTYDFGGSFSTLISVVFWVVASILLWGLLLVAEDQ